MSTPGSVPNQQENTAVLQRMQTEAVVKAGAGWFVWIAALSMLNSLISVFGGGWRFIFGLGITQVVDAIAHQAGNTGAVLDLIINGCVAGLILVFWNFARKGAKWGFLVGMVLYALDGVLCLLFKDILAGAFHAWALFRIYQGFSAVSVLDSFQQSDIAAGAPIVPR